MSDEVWKAMRGLRQYLFEHVYLNPVAKGEGGEGDAYDTNLYHIYMEKPELMPEQFLNMLENGTASKRTDSVRLYRRYDRFLRSSYI